MLMSGGDPSVFVTHPISLAFMFASLAILLTMTVPAISRRRLEIAD